MVEAATEVFCKTWNFCYFWELLLWRTPANYCFSTGLNLPIKNLKSSSKEFCFLVKMLDVSLKANRKLTELFTRVFIQEILLFNCLLNLICFRWSNCCFHFTCKNFVLTKEFIQWYFCIIMIFLRWGGWLNIIPKFII